ncbi:hypothetical protein [Pseudopelagicola sp. nBUS_19]
MIFNENVVSGWDAVIEEFDNPFKSYTLTTAHVLMQELVKM